MGATFNESNSGPRRGQLTVEDYVAGVRSRELATLARTLTLVESNHPRHQALAEQVLTRLLPHTGGATRVGITGVPGVGKSTFIESLGMHLVRRGLRVAVLAVDPSSGLSGGSILGDKTRMAKLSLEPNAFIRPSPSAGTLGGVGRKTRETMLICEAAGYEVVMIETVGVGQSETVVAQMTDCFLALMLPGAGDELQGIKRGLLELVDVLAVNKADGAMRAAAELAASQYRTALQSLAGRAHHPPDVLICSALKDQGIDDVWNAVADRRRRLVETSQLQQRRQRQNLHWLRAILEDQLHHSINTSPAVQAIRADLEKGVLAGTITPTHAARRILQALGFPEVNAAR